MKPSSSLLFFASILLVLVFKLAFTGKEKQKQEEIFKKKDILFFKMLLH